MTVLTSQTPSFTRSLSEEQDQEDGIKASAPSVCPSQTDAGKVLTKYVFLSRPTIVTDADGDTAVAIMDDG